MDPWQQQGQNQPQGPDPYYGQPPNPNLQPGQAVPQQPGQPNPQLNPNIPAQMPQPFAPAPAQVMTPYNPQPSLQTPTASSGKKGPNKLLLAAVGGIILVVILGIIAVALNSGGTDDKQPAKTQQSGTQAKLNRA